MPRLKRVAKKHCRRFGIVDLAFTEKKENDYTAILACAVTPGQDLLCLDMHRERMEGPKILPAIEAMGEKWDLAYWGIEAVQAQLLVVQALRKKGWTVRALKADTDKLSRAIPAIARMESGQIYLPFEAYWLADFITELLSFNHGAHDDQVDALSYAAVEVQRFGGAAEPDEYEKLREQANRELAEVARQENLNDPSWWDADDDRD